MSQHTNLTGASLDGIKSRPKIPDLNSHESNVDDDPSERLVWRLKDLHEAEERLRFYEFLQRTLEEQFEHKELLERKSGERPPHEQFLERKYEERLQHEQSLYFGHEELQGRKHEESLRHAEFSRKNHDECLRRKASLETKNEENFPNQHSEIKRGKRGGLSASASKHDNKSVMCDSKDDTEMHDPRLASHNSERDPSFIKALSPDASKEEENHLHGALQMIYSIPMRVREIACQMRNSIDKMARSGKRLSYQSPIPGLVLIHEDMVEISSDLHLEAKAWMVPEKDRKSSSDPSWALVKAGYVVETEHVSNIVSKVTEAVTNVFKDIESWAQDFVESKLSPYIIRVVSPLAGSGLSSAFRLAAFLCSKSISTHSVYFLESGQTDIQWAKFMNLVSEDILVILFVDCEISTSLLDTVIEANPFTVVVLGTRVPSEQDDVIVKTVWSKSSLDRLYRMLSNFTYPLEQEVAQKALSAVMQEMNSRGKGSFYMLPWVASRGLYAPVQQCVEIQAAAAIEAKQVELVNLIALLSLTSSRAVVFKHNLDPQKFPLLVIHPQTEGGFSYRFAHPAMAATYLHHVFNSDSKMRFKSVFPADYLELWRGSIGGMIDRMPRQDIRKLIQEILHSSEEERLTPFVDFVTKHELNRDFLTVFEQTCEKAGVPAVEKFMVLSRMCRSNNWLQSDLSLVYAEFAVECAVGRSNEFKARACYTESLALCAAAENEDSCRKIELKIKAGDELKMLLRDSLDLEDALCLDRLIAQCDKYFSGVKPKEILGKKRSCQNDDQD